MKPSSPWWFEGLRFSCVGCGRCCRGEPGAIFFSRYEEMRIAYCLGLSLGEFRRGYVTGRWGLPSIDERWNGECLFYDPATARCRIYPTRPLQCRTWPFWPEILDTPESWRKASKMCPGMDQGVMHDGPEIKGILDSYVKYLGEMVN
ncbi:MULTISPECIES: YkgJ family cysteine cluster protein [Dethiosulfovibrio]|jgi:hypothetical protein|uniref:YkgJ family cysteine cluster protein n=2 Tax=Dethiosulfovibrio TaxID=47054 RepID=A0ABS9EK27_9BACT|nr:MULTISPECIES: YkgJ family cysteine cluster protein [Dethiosulfovibrio]MCF4113046.1 YkgJ family cysteine cluster protein [Dethiosulfovibrio russensis]MCF4141510.1 YkgJ family cysteine cluster protein [Dethiosulfovibrio marinus]MCF4144466.1 YkgJ family cysteine cluster protein [Dethiosulfovibrio acidaminovorans]